MPIVQQKQHISIQSVYCKYDAGRENSSASAYVRRGKEKGKWEAFIQSGMQRTR